MSALKSKLRQTRQVRARRYAEITCFLNYHGVGLQFAAIGALLHRKAVTQGAGRELPTDWFTEDVHS